MPGLDSPRHLSRCKLRDAVRVIASERAGSGRKPRLGHGHPRSPGFSTGTCGAGGWNANDRCSSTSDGGNRRPVNSSVSDAFRQCWQQRINGWAGVGRRLLLIIHRIPTFIEAQLASHQEISAFLAVVERRAFKQALFAVRDEDSALDVVQDAMLKLTEKYTGKPVAELPMLFQRILQNTIHDHFRRQKVRSAWTTLFSSFGQKDDKDDDFDLLETLPAKSDSNRVADPARQVEQGQIVGLIEQALTRLPARQREAFLLRYWEELDVAEA